MGKMGDKIITVGELKEFIQGLPDDMKVYMVSDDNMPVRKVVDMSYDIRMGYYKELYLDTTELN